MATRTTSMLVAADDFEYAAEQLATMGAPGSLLSDLTREANWLRYGDLADLGALSAFGEDRYVDSSRASRRATVLRWINRYAPTQRDSQPITRALDAIDGNPAS